MNSERIETLERCLAIQERHIELIHDVSEHEQNLGIKPREDRTPKLKQLELDVINLKQLIAEIQGLK